MQKSNKHIISLILCMIICINFNIPVLANENQKNTSDGIEWINITNLNTGETFILDSSIMKSTTAISNNGDIEKKIVANISIPQSSTRNSVTDAGVTVKITLDLDYITSGTQYKLKTVKGSFKVLDNAFSISDRHVKIGNFDNSCRDNIFDKYPGVTFSYTLNDRWIDSSYWPAIVGAYAECTMSRSSNSWSVRCTNIPVQNGMDLTVI